jgi:hypothetical protein
MGEEYVLSHSRVRRTVCVGSCNECLDSHADPYRSGECEVPRDIDARRCRAVGTRSYLLEQTQQFINSARTAPPWEPDGLEDV